MNLSFQIQKASAKKGRTHFGSGCARLDPTLLSKPPGSAASFLFGVAGCKTRFWLAGDQSWGGYPSTLRQTPVNEKDKNFNQRYNDASENDHDCHIHFVGGGGFGGGFVGSLESKIFSSELSVPRGENTATLPPYWGGGRTQSATKKGVLGLDPHPRPSFSGKYLSSFVQDNKKTVQKTLRYG